MWERILLQNGKYIREARGKCIQYKTLNRYYYTPVRLNSMGLIQSSSCGKCKSECGTYIHALWECRMVFPLWNNVLALMEDWLGCQLPRSPQLCLLGDKGGVTLKT
uniref:Reverse transcriptase zinc-binding domain-containing protein n=1 Tax=Labrus bergylta TaxID=56723 RepID=A0A3Q3MMF7_9LABR